MLWKIAAILTIVYYAILVFFDIKGRRQYKLELAASNAIGQTGMEEEELKVTQPENGNEENKEASNFFGSTSNFDEVGVVDESPAKASAEKPSARLEEVRKEAVAETPVAKSDEVLKKASAEKPSANLEEVRKEAVAETPVAKSDEVPIKASAEKPSAKLEEVPQEAVAETPVAKSDEVLKEAPAEKPSGKSDEVPQEAVAETPVAKSDEVPIKAAAEKPSAKLEEVPQEAVAETPVAKSDGVPKEASAEKPSVKLEEVPTEAVAETPVAKSDEVPQEASAEKPSAKLEELLKEAPEAEITDEDREDEKRRNLLFAGTSFAGDTGMADDLFKGDDDVKKTLEALALDYEEQQGKKFTMKRESLIPALEAFDGAEKIGEHQMVKLIEQTSGEAAG